MGNDRDIGKLFLCPTPIGNLQDITYRVLECFRQVDVIACEDTRRTKKLLNHYNISGGSLVSYYKFNQEKRGRELIQKMLSGCWVALASDAGTPGISDPGTFLVQEAIRQNIEVTALPGPSAGITALSASGLPTDQFLFLGFIPEKGTDRKGYLERIVVSDCTVILYESPHRLKNTLSDLAPLLKHRQVVVAKELTKMHEGYLRGTPQEILDQIASKPLQGELTLLIEGSQEKREDMFSDMSIQEHLREVIGKGFTKKQAIQIVSDLRDVPKRSVYEQALELEKRY